MVPAPASVPVPDHPNGFCKPGVDPAEPGLAMVVVGTGCVAASVARLDIVLAVAAVVVVVPVGAPAPGKRAPAAPGLWLGSSTGRRLLLELPSLRHGFFVGARCAHFLRRRFPRSALWLRLRLALGVLLPREGRESPGSGLLMLFRRRFRLGGRFEPGESRRSLCSALWLRLRLGDGVVWGLVPALAAVLVLEVVVLEVVVLEVVVLEVVVLEVVVLEVVVLEMVLVVVREIGQSPFPANLDVPAAVFVPVVASHAGFLVVAAVAVVVAAAVAAVAVVAVVAVVVAAVLHLHPPCLELLPTIEAPPVWISSYLPALGVEW